MAFEQRVTKAPTAEEFSTTMQETLAQTKANLQKAQDQMKAQADKHCSDAPKYNIRDKIWLSTKNLKLTHTSKKLTKRWLGPYDIIKLVGENATRLHLPHNEKPSSSQYIPYLPIQRTSRRTDILLTRASECH